MPRSAPANAERVVLSPEDAEIADLFVIRRSYNKDGSLRYVQVIGNAGEVDAYARGEKVEYKPDSKEGEQKAMSLPRLVAQRMLRRPLEPSELIQPDNGLNGDCRRSNLKITSRSQIASAERPGSWSESGEKYVYENSLGRYYVNYHDIYLGTYDTTDQASAALNKFHEMLAQGMNEEEATRRIKGRSRSIDRVVIQP